MPDDDESQPLSDILAGLFGLEVLEPTYTPFKVFVDDPENYIRHNELANAELERLGLKKKHLFHVLRTIRSKEFKCMSDATLDAYRSKADELNKGQKEASAKPVDDDHILQYVHFYSNFYTY